MRANVNERKIILDLAVTLDGFIEGENGEIDWCIMDPEMDFTKFLNQIDTILYGRKSYDLWGRYMPKDEDSEAEKEMWEMIHSKKKYVFSRTEKGTGHQAIFVNDNILEEMKKLKKKPGKDIWLYGGASLITTFIKLRLVDEFRLSIHPVVLGKGKPLFMDIEQRLQLRVADVRRYTSGVVQIIYRRDEE